MNDASDPALDEVEAELYRLDEDGSRWASVIRHTYDVVYNGQESGRYRWDQLLKTEKTHFGTLFEIYAQRSFRFQDGVQLDFQIAGHEVDAKWSQKEGGWMLPPEIFGKIALVATGDDKSAKWSLGLVRVRPEYLSQTSLGNRDRKKSLNAAGRASVRWLWRNAGMSPNVLLSLPADTVEGLFRNFKHGNQRLNELFRVAEGMLVNRNTVATVSMQLDPQKRVRDNGGSRAALAPEGYVILSGVYHAHIAAALGVRVPAPDEYISVRVVPSSDGSGAIISGTRWRRAMSGETPCVPAPTLPERGTREE